MVTDVKDVQSRKASSPIVLTLFGRTTCVMLEQKAKACLPIDTTLLGMEMFFRLTHPENAKSLIIDKVEGSVIVTSSVQFWKALLSIVVTPSAKDTVFTVVPLKAPVIRYASFGDR